MATGTGRRVPPTWIVLAVLVVAETVSAFESAMVYVAFPRLMTDFSVDAATVAWVGTAYLLVAAAAGSLGGRFGDIYGRRRILLGVLAISAIGSLVSLLSPTLWGIVAGRAIQGAAGAILPLAIAIAREILGPGARAIGVAAVSASALIAGAGGGLVAGLLIDFGSWHNLFLVAAIAAVVAFVLVLFVLPPTARMVSQPRVDLVGAVLLVVSVASILGGVTFSRSSGWLHLDALGLVVLGLVVLAVFVLWERRVPPPGRPGPAVPAQAVRVHPAGDRGDVRRRPGRQPSALPIIFQAPTGSPVGLGQTATFAGAVTFGTSILSFLVSPLIGRLMIAIGTPGS